MHTVHQRPKKELRNSISKIEEMIAKIYGLIFKAIRINSNREVEISGRQE